MCMLIFKGIFFLHLLGLSYHGPIDIEENVIIPVNYTSIPKAGVAVIEVKRLGEDIPFWPCHILLDNGCKSISDGCQCTQTSPFTCLVNITYSSSSKHEFQMFRVVIRDDENERHPSAWQPFPKNKEPGLINSHVNLTIPADSKDTHSDQSVKRDSENTSQICSETCWHCYLTFGLTLLFALVVIAVLSLLLYKSYGREKILKSKIIPTSDVTIKTGDPHVVNKLLKKKLKLNDDSRSEIEEGSHQAIPENEQTELTPMRNVMGTSLREDIDVNETAQ